MKTSFFGTKWAFHDFLQNLQKLKILNKWNLFFCSCLIFNLLFLGLSSISYGYTVDVGKSVEEVLEYETLKGSCDTYWSLIENDEESEKIRIFERKCGKWLFLFWETSGELPLPIMLYDAMRRSWPDLTGDHFEKLGFIKNPYSPEGWPVGVVRSTKKYMGLPSINVNCASCHVGKLPDGRYAVGAPNTELDMSQFNLMSYYSVYIAMNKEEKKILSPEVVAYYENLKRLERRRYRDENGKIDWSNSVFKYSYLLSILGIGTKGLPDADYVKMPPAADLKSWLDGRPGVFNPGAPMLTVQVKDVPNLAVPQIWELGGHGPDIESGHQAPLGIVAKYGSLEDFLRSAIVYTYQAPELAVEKYVKPLASYLRSLKAPKNPKKPKESDVIAGRAEFTRSCLSCHNGPGFETQKLYLAEEVGASSSLDYVMENYKPTTPIAELIAKLSMEIDAAMDPSPIGIKSRSFVGIWARKNLMLDGSVEDLNDLFCLEHENHRSPGLSRKVHRDLCEDFSKREKKNLKSFLETL